MLFIGLFKNENVLFDPWPSVCKKSPYSAVYAAAPAAAVLPSSNKENAFLITNTIKKIGSQHNTNSLNLIMHFFLSLGLFRVLTI